MWSLHNITAWFNKRFDFHEINFQQMWWMASSPSIISDNKPSHLCTWLGLLLNAIHTFARNFVSNRCSSDTCIKAVLCMMFLLLHYYTMRSHEQVSVIGRLRFMAHDHRENLIWLFIIRDVVGHKMVGNEFKDGEIMWTNKNRHNNQVYVYSLPLKGYSAVKGTGQKPYQCGNFDWPNNTLS